jgi:hypothetical protein
MRRAFAHCIETLSAMDEENAALKDSRLTLTRNERTD